MKKSIINLKKKSSLMFAILLITIDPDLAFAQNKNQTSSLESELEVNDLVVPNAPASAIIGSQINLKPAITPRAFGLSFLNSIANESGEFPNNIAVEFSPYWWSPRPELTFEDYYNKNGFGQFIRQSLSFSIASDASTVTTDNDEEIDITKLGIGMRFALIAGKANPQVKNIKDELLDEIKNCQNYIAQEISKRKPLKKKLVENQGEFTEEDFSILLETISFLEKSDEISKKIKSVRDSQIDNERKKEKVKKILFEIYDKDKDLISIINKITQNAGIERTEKCIQDNEEIDELNNKLKDLEKARVGLQLETASAVGFDFRENDFDEFKFRNFATWLTASYRGGGSVKDDKASPEEENKISPKASPIEFLGVARYTLDEFEDDTDSFFDIGAGIVYRLQKTPLAFSLEYIRRFGDDGDDRFVGVADYRINDTYSVFLSYGKDFEDEFEGNEDLVTLFGLKVGFGRNSTPTVSVPK